MGEYSNIDFLKKVERDRAKLKQQEYLMKKVYYAREKLLKEERVWNWQYAIASKVKKLAMREEKNNQKLKRFLH